MAHNPVHQSVRYDFLAQVANLDRLIAIARKNDSSIKTRIAHDTLLAKRTVLSSLMSHSGAGSLPASRNLVARDYRRLAYYPSRFNTLFDNCMAIAIMEA
jgi:hypothetical protein